MTDSRVYVVVQEYWGYTFLCGVFTSKRRAQNYIDRQPEKVQPEFSVEVFDLNKPEE